jgi:hypothetical protein
MKPRVARIAYWILCVSLLAGCSGQSESSTTREQGRQEEVRSNGARVMPFSLDKTIHIFTKTADGGEQSVIIRNPSDSSELGLIRNHLREIADEFADGNFNDPSAIHGLEMPGLKTLQGKPEGFTIKFVNLSEGAKLIYRSTDPIIIKALHNWFDAQVIDHGRDALSDESHFSEMNPDLLCAHHTEICLK